jgi:hypothetical protein
MVLIVSVRCNNFTSCLQDLKNLNLEVSEEEEVQHSKFLLCSLLPFLKRLDAEQMTEREIEARIRGILLFQIFEINFISNKYFSMILFKFQNGLRLSMPEIDKNEILYKKVLLLWDEMIVCCFDGQIPKSCDYFFFICHDLCFKNKSFHYILCSVFFFLIGCRRPFFSCTCSYSKLKVALTKDWL